MAARNARQRRAVLKALIEVRRQLALLRDHWDVRGTVHVEPQERAPGSNTWQRPRRPDEYPEERPESWAYLYNVTDETVRTLVELREIALRRYKEIQPEGDRGSESQVRHG